MKKTKKVIIELIAYGREERMKEEKRNRDEIKMKREEERGETWRRNQE